MLFKVSGFKHCILLECYTFSDLGREQTALLPVRIQLTNRKSQSKYRYTLTDYMTLTERRRVDNSPAAHMAAEIKQLALRATLWPRQSKVCQVANCRPVFFAKWHMKSLISSASNWFYIYYCVSFFCRTLAVQLDNKLFQPRIFFSAITFTKPSEELKYYYCNNLFSGNGGLSVSF